MKEPVALWHAEHDDFRRLNEAQAARREILRDRRERRRRVPAHPRRELVPAGRWAATGALAVVVVAAILAAATSALVPNPDATANTYAVLSAWNADPVPLPTLAPKLPPFKRCNRILII